MDHTVAMANDQIGIDQIVIRRAVPADRPALERLAILDAGALLDVPTLVAECDGDLVAAFPLDGGRALADPFHPTEAIVGLLSLRARQLGAPASGRRRTRLLRRRVAVRPQPA
jgi:hypothetical protein